MIACALTGAGSRGDVLLDAWSWVFVFFYLLKVYLLKSESSKSSKSLTKFTKLKNSRLSFCFLVCGFWFLFVVSTKNEKSKTEN